MKISAHIEVTGFMCKDLWCLQFWWFMCFGFTLCSVVHSNVLKEQAAFILTGHLKMATVFCSTKSLAPANRIMSYAARLQQLGSL